jgi:hypothetical protein
MLAMIAAVLAAARYDNISFVAGFGSGSLLSFHWAIVIVLTAIATHWTMAVLAAVHITARRRFVRRVAVELDRVRTSSETEYEQREQNNQKFLFHFVSPRSKAPRVSRASKPHTSAPVIISGATVP